MTFEERTKERLQQALERVLVASRAPEMKPLHQLQRNGLIQEARLLAARWSLEEQMAAFVYSHGCEALTGLEVEQLLQLVDHLNELGLRVDTACDPPSAPPAR